jgi:hypothetical protein
MMSDEGEGKASGGAEAQPTPTPATPMQPPSDGAPWSGTHGARGRRGGTFIGIALIVIGVLVLLGQVTSLSGVLRLWPLLVVAAGIGSMVRPHRWGRGTVVNIVGGLTTVVIGLILLANTWGYLGWNVWLSVFSLWPLLVIAWGLELLGRGIGQRWLGVVGALLVLGGLLYGALILGPRHAPVTWFPFTGVVSTSPFASDLPHDPALAQADASIKVGATQLVVGAGEKLASIDGLAPAGDAPVLASTSASGSASVTVTEPGGSRTFDVGSQTLDVRLDRAATWRSVALDVGAVDGRIDLSGLDVQAVSVNSGASHLALTVGTRSPRVTIAIQGGAADITLRIPAGAAVNLDAKSGLSDVTVPPSYRRVAGAPVLGESRWIAQGTGPRIDISVQSGVSSVTLQTY